MALGMNWIYDPTIPGIIFWVVAGLIGATVGLSLYVGFCTLQNWRNGT